MYERSGALLERKFKEYLIPTLLTTIAISLATVVDSIIVGNLLGETALSAVGLSGPVIFILNMVFVLFAAGGVTCASVAKGRRENDRANRMFTFTFAAGLAVMIVLVCVFQAVMEPMCDALAQGDALLAELTRSYLKYLVFVGPVMMLIMGMAQFVRIDGRPKTAALIAVVANGVDLLLSYALIKYFNSGIAGAAISTVIGYIAGIFMLLPYLFSKKRSLRFAAFTPAELKELIDIIRIGLPKGLTQGVSFLRTAALNTLIVAALGAAGMAAMTLCINVLMLANIFVGGSNDTLLPIVGTLYGEKDTAGVRFAVRRGVIIMCASVCALMAVFLIVPGFVAGLFGIASEDGMSIALTAVRLYALCLPFYGINLLLQNFYQTTGREKFASVIACLNGLIFVTAFAALLSVINGNLIWLAFALSEAATLLVILFYCAIVRKKKGLKGVLLLRQDGESGASLDITIPATILDAAAMSQQVIQFCKDNNAGDSGATRMGVAAEEMAVNIAKYGHAGRRGVIDVLIRIIGGQLILRVRDDGIFFDPTKYSPREKNESGLAIGGIEVVRKLADKIEYSCQLGFNVTIITISMSELNGPVAD